MNCDAALLAGGKKNQTNQLRSLQGQGFFKIMISADFLCQAVITFLPFHENHVLNHSHHRWDMYHCQEKHLGWGYRCAEL